MLVTQEGHDHQRQVAALTTPAWTRRAIRALGQGYHRSTPATRHERFLERTGTSVSISRSETLIALEGHHTTDTPRQLWTRRRLPENACNRQAGRWALGEVSLARLDQAQDTNKRIRGLGTEPACCGPYLIQTEHDAGHPQETNHMGELVGELAQVYRNGWSTLELEVRPGEAGDLRRQYRRLGELWWYARTAARGA